MSVLFGSLYSLYLLFSGVYYCDIWTGAYDSPSSESLWSAAKDRGDAVEIGIGTILGKSLLYTTGS